MQHKGPAKVEVAKFCHCHFLTPKHLIIKKCVSHNSLSISEFRIISALKQRYVENKIGPFAFFLVHPLRIRNIKTGAKYQLANRET